MNPIKKTYGKNGAPELPAIVGFTKPSRAANPNPVKWTNDTCRHPAHYPPKYIALRQEEIHAHTCPGCGKSCYLKVKQYSY